MKTVWVVEDGEYSDYRVVGVFSSRKNAEMVRARVGGAVAEWTLDPGIHELSRGYTCFLGEMLRDGTVERMVAWEMSSYDLSRELDLWRRSTAPAYKGLNVQDCLHGTVLAKDMKHAVKIFNEKRTQLIALGKWE